MDHFQIPKASGESAHFNLMKQLEDYDILVVGLMGVSNSPQRGFGIAPGDLELIRTLEKRQKVVTVLFGNVYASKYLEGLEHVVFAYENSPFTQKLVPQILFGARPAKGILPVTVSEQFIQGVGGLLAPQNRLAYGSPESVGMDGKSSTKLMQ